MSHAIDFGELKQRVSIERAAEMLGIKLTKSGPQLRGPCPDLQSGRRSGVRHHAGQGPLLLLRHMRQGRRRDHDGGERPQLFASRGGRVLGWQGRGEFGTGKGRRFP